MAKGKKRRIATKLEEVFNISFAELIGKNFKKGDSRYDVQKRLLEMIVEKELTAKAVQVFPESLGCWDSSKWTYDNFGAISKESNPAFRPSTLYHAIKDVKDEGELDSFDFCASNKGRKVDSRRKQPSLSVELTCSKCGRRHKNNGMENISNLNLRVYPCPSSSCGAFGKCIAKITEGGKVRFKAIIKIDGIRQESFVVSETDLTPVEEKTPGSIKENNISIETDQKETVTSSTEV